MTDIEKLADRYVQIWNDPDRAALAELWAPDGVEYTDENRYRGHDELERRITGAYDELVAGQGFRFHRDGPVVGHDGMVTFRATMVPTGGGAVAWNAQMVLLLDADGRIERDYQFQLG
jgi:uncharacterized protein